MKTGQGSWRHTRAVALLSQGSVKHGFHIGSGEGPRRGQRAPNTLGEEAPGTIRGPLSIRSRRRMRGDTNHV